MPKEEYYVIVDVPDEVRLEMAREDFSLDRLLAAELKKEGEAEVTRAGEPGAAVDKELVLLIVATGFTIFMIAGAIEKVLLARAEAKRMTAQTIVREPMLNEHGDPVKGNDGNVLEKTTTGLGAGSTYQSGNTYKAQVGDVKFEVKAGTKVS